MTTPERGPSAGVTFRMWDGDRLRGPGEVLEVVGERTSGAAWRVEAVEAAGEAEAAAAMERLGAAGPVPDAELRKVASSDVQLVDATLSVGEPPLLVIRAVDSTDWDVLSDDATLLEALRMRFGAADLPPSAIEPPGGG